MAEDPKDEKRTLECGKHGRMPWRGEIMCETCRRVFLPPWENLKLDASIISVPEADYPMCDCGAQLFPGEGDQDFSGVPICTACYEDTLTLN